MEQTRGRGRPPVTTRDAVEDVAMTLFEERGIENTTVVDIAEACQMSKTSFFRYFTSKNDILWGAFEGHVQAMKEMLRSQPADAPILPTLREGIRELIVAETEHVESWLRRFRFQNTDEQRALTLIHWGEWESTVAEYIRDRSKAPAASLIPDAMAGTLRGAFRAFLRHWVLSGNTNIEDLLKGYDEALAPVFGGLEMYLARIPKAHA
ncbi:TetR/AcrR family transcriptional regulator [Gulosibacter molinativorax]|uniref:HTH tetR-type domain-containing protein n=1 Tax=Gulosibacter molinativorax TaxID=256821 RepID=A0ABT7C582_9MICO|nr:TetR/AcrR family transcriptional regulator [Gulosibacter molinativorax]MDJ1370357.1 hypothetical protein [Gulosibacter molinativorax]QUY61270.1 Hypotetical protein [Gulosibacter molinativorax]